MNKPQQAAQYIRSFAKEMPQIGMVLGSGLGALAQEIKNPIYIPYDKIPHFATSTAPGHEGRFVLGEFSGKQVICMQGRVHFYEGYPMEQITLPIRTMKSLGVDTLILTNAVGAVNENFSIGDFMLITDHINHLGTNPLIGENDPDFGPRFCDMSYTYDKNLQNLFHQVAKEENIPIQEGIYFATTGPSYETPAEVRAFRTWGADVVGMSTVPEAIVANHCGMKILAVSCVTNMAAGILDVTLSEEEVIEIASQRAPYFKTLIRNVVAKIDTISSKSV